MKIKNILSLLLAFISLNAIAQDGPFIRKKKEQIKALKVAFITDELSLTPDEATKFWPLFNAFEDKQQEIKKQKLKGYLDRMDDDSFDKLTEKEATTMLRHLWYKEIRNLIHKIHQGEFLIGYRHNKDSVH